ncbi:hypothetical protein [Desulfocurvibacter africanus]|uniref:hypothetical protein n=1 Tax=Desulfocurvibacter africanus TaxID=873 RepID=UPI000348AE29|nr:hypothetical protein [Desulfocurvibacter africanus]
MSVVFAKTRHRFASRLALRAARPPSYLPAKPIALRLKQTVRATFLSCAVQMDKLTEDVLPEFERLCAAVAEP